jgi:phosphoenolpyruvate-protein kinase (PTS system EI component)
VEPSDALLHDARARLAEREREREESEERASMPLSHLGVAVRANIGGIEERVPRGAEGIGLLRTELVFAGHREPPSETEQVMATLAIARAAGAGPVVARLFDAGGDKPLPWLAPPAHAPHARGIELLLLHPAILRTQVRALCRAAEAAPVSILLPLARNKDDIFAVRALATRETPVGAMIETEDAVRSIDAIAEAADFICIGTNDLTADVLRVGRERSDLSFDRHVLRLVRQVIDRAHAHGKRVTVCGEIAGVERGARILVGMDADAISVAPPRVTPVKLSLFASTKDECRAAAREAV